MTGCVTAVIMPFCERPPFMLRKVAFWRVKDGLLQGERWPFTKRKYALMYSLACRRRLKSVFFSCLAAYPLDYVSIFCIFAKENARLH